MHPVVAPLFSAGRGAVLTPSDLGGRDEHPSDLDGLMYGWIDVLTVLKSPPIVPAVLFNFG
jgi:hypothetical protein